MQPDMPEADAGAEVLIVGGGPVGLTARALLERWGVRILLVEKHRELSPFPRSRLINVRTMEIFRQLELAERVTAAAFAPEYGRIRFRDTLHAPDFASAAMIGVNGPVPESPVTGVVTSQDRLEPTLLGAAASEVRFGVELVDLAEENGSVVARLADRGTGEHTRVRARYVLAADGADSTVRERLGIGTEGPGAVGRVTTVVFDADLGHWSARQPAGVYLTSQGSFLPLYPEGGWAWFTPTPEDPDGTDWPRLVARSLGAEAKIDILRVQHWAVNAFVAERFRRGRTLLAGDAAHAIPPVGGLGMNLGVADVHNLCWKLAGVLRGWAGPALLDSYEKERRPVAHRTLGQALENSKMMFQVQDMRREQLGAGAGRVPEAIEPPWSEQYFAQLGLVLGVAYRSGAVLTGDGKATMPPETGTTYVPTAEPGHRVPHLWLTDGRSTLDAFGEWFTLLTAAPADWRSPATPPWPLRVEPLPAEHTDQWDLPPQGALLVRPDGHIAARWSDGPPGDGTLHDALTAITSR
ncbi:FAD-dependent monooxygenase [Streptomyces sp. WAC 01325]|uniref:FAD-dependent monooxygenase n=1 Tax=Streptomyces sp. WAC 01325 TaxID=2203202 RepID=UPI0021AF8A78|nr:FAD-dependent monooxygenase [Streptomyces sp. WAC 01325]